MKITQNHPNCQKCKLCDDCESPWMESHGASDPVVLVIGEAPGEQEDILDRPFVGRSGKLLRETLEDSGFNLKEEVRFTNVVRCRPPENKIAKKHINYCKHFTLDEIDYYDPDLVLLMGNTPLNAVLGESGITTWNGVVVERDDRVFVPLFHPAYILRNAEATGDWIDGLDKAVEVMENGREEDDVTYHYPKTYKEVDDMCDYLTRHHLIAYDTETGSLDPFAKDNCMPCLSLAAGNRSYAVPLFHAESSLKGKDRQDAIILIRDVLMRKKQNIIGHNIKFDIQHTRKLLGFTFAAFGDTMLVSHMLDSRRGIHGLKRLAGLHLGMYDYDKELQEYIKEHPECNPKRGGSYANVPIDILLPYAAKDTHATLRLWEVLWPQLTKKQQHFFMEAIMGGNNALADMEYNGTAVDNYVVERYVQQYSRIREEYLEKILREHDKAIGNVLRGIQSEKDQRIIHSLPDDAVDWTIEDTHIHYERETGRKGKRKRDLVVFNPNSTDQIRRLYFDEYEIPVQGTTDSGLPSTSAKVMGHLGKDWPIIKDVVYYGLLTKMLGTYLNPIYTGEVVSGDGRVRSTYNQHGTITGRTSSSNPNLQNIPTPEKEADNNPMAATVWMPIKNVFTHSWWTEPKQAATSILNGDNLASNGVIMSVDYSGMELRVFASLAECAAMLAIHKSGADFHSMVSIMASQGRDVHDITKEEAAHFKKTQMPTRYRYKWTNWTLLYGGDEFTLVRLYGIDPDEAKHTVESYYGAFPEVLDFRKKCIRFARKYGYIESPFGRREHLPYIKERGSMGRKSEREAVNMPVQSAASDTLIIALAIIHHKLKEGKYDTMLVNTVHDSTVMDVPWDEIKDVAALSTDVMENIVSYSADYFPHVSFDWLKCPLIADVEVGTHYGTEISYSQWLKETNNGMPIL